MTPRSDHIAVYSESSKALVANIAAGGTGSLPGFDPGTGNLFENLTPNYNNGSVVAPLVLSSSYGTSLPITGFVVAADGALGRLYVGANNGDFLVLNSPTYSTLHTFPATSFSSVVADTSLGLFYVSNPDEELRRSVSRAVNRMNAELFRPFAHRMTPAAVVPVHTPEEAIEGF